MDTDDVVTVEKLDNGLWVWICQPESGAFYQGAKHFKRKQDALAAGREFAVDL